MSQANSPTDGPMKIPEQDYRMARDNQTDYIASFKVYVNLG